MGASLSVDLSQVSVNESSRTATVSIVVKITSTAGTHNHYGSSDLGQGALLYVTIDGNTYSQYVTFGSSSTGTYTSTVYSNSITVSYSSSGTKTVSASARCVTGTSAGTIRGSDSLSLTPIGSSSGGSGGDDGGDNTEEWDPDNPGSGGGTGGVSPLPGNSTLIGQAKLKAATSDPDYTMFDDGMITYSSAAGSSQICIIKFTTPNFKGVSTSLIVNLYGPEISGVKDGAVSYALCSSDINNGMYIGASSVVDDPNQIAYGAISKSDWPSGTFTIQTDALKSKHDYYIVMWQHSDFPRPVTNVAPVFKFGPARLHGITVEYDPFKIAYIDNAVQHIDYLCFVDSGTDWIEYEMYIDNGTSFELYG